MGRQRIILLFLCSVCVLGTFAQRVKHLSGKHYNHMVDSFATLPPITSSDIVMLGDSHTEFGNWKELFPQYSNIQDRGIIGDDAGGIINRLSQVCSHCPKAIFFECGANDLSHGLSARKVAADVLRVIDKIRKACPRTKLYVQGVFPINEDFGRWKALKGKTNVIPEINTLLKRGCKARGVEYIDLFSLFKEPHTNKMRKEICKDGLHLLPSGYQIWAEAITPYIENLNKCKK